MVKDLCMRVIVLLWYGFTQILPRRVHVSVGRWLGHVFLTLPVRKRRIARTNITLCFPTYSTAQVDRLLRHNAAMIGKAIFDVAIAWFWRDDKIRRDLPHQINGLDLLQRDDKRGVLLLFKHSLHFMLDARVLSLYHRIYGVTRDVKNSSYINDLYMKSRLHACQDIALPHEPLKFVRWLKKGYTICYALDHDYGLENSIIANFFKQPAATLTAPYKMRKMTNCRICMLDSYYDEKGRLIMDITEPMHLNEDCEREFLQALNDATTDQIAKHPHEYHWYYGRFKSMKVYQKAEVNE